MPVVTGMYSNTEDDRRARLVGRPVTRAEWDGSVLIPSCGIDGKSTTVCPSANVRPEVSLARRLILQTFAASGYSDALYVFCIPLEAADGDRDPNGSASLVG